MDCKCAFARLGQTRMCCCWVWDVLGVGVGVDTPMAPGWIPYMCHVRSRSWQSSCICLTYQHPPCLGKDCMLNCKCGSLLFVCETSTLSWALWTPIYDNMYNPCGEILSQQWRTTNTQDGAEIIYSFRRSSVQICVCTCLVQSYADGSDVLASGGKRTKINATSWRWIAIQYEAIDRWTYFHRIAVYNIYPSPCN